MNEEKQNKVYFQETFREVHAPQELAERLMNMEELKNKKVGSVAKWLAVAAVAAVILFAGSNGIAYAMTGNTWMETLVYKLTLEGVEYDVDLQEQKKGNGETWYTGTFQEEDGDESKLILINDGTLPLIVTSQSAELRGSNGNWYIKDGDIQIDVTKDLNEDGQASGTYERNGYTKEYRVWRNDAGQVTYAVRTIYDGMEEEWSTDKLMPVESGGAIAAPPTPTPEP